MKYIEDNGMMVIVSALLVIAELSLIHNRVINIIIALIIVFFSYAYSIVNSLGKSDE